MLRWDVNRREFMKITAGAGAALAMPTPGHAAVSSSKMIGIQVGAISFVDEGTEKVLDVLQERACVNTLFLAVFTYGRGIAGRQIPGQPLPDHGKQEYDLNFHGGNFATPHPQYYKNTVLKDTRAPDHGDLDILAEVLPAAKKRGMKVICWLEDVFRTDLPNIEKVQERDLYGRNAETLCVNNPDYRNFFTGLVEDFARSYDIDGIMWGSERQGALSDSLGATHDTPPIDPGNVTCFCEFCQRKAKGARHQCGARQARISGAGKIRSLGAQRQTPRGRLLRSILADPVAVSRTGRMGNALHRRPSRDLRRALQNGKDGQADDAGGLAHLAQQFLQSHLPRGTGPARTLELFRFHKGRDVQQLRRRADGAVCGQYRLDTLWRSLETGR